MIQAKFTQTKKIFSQFPTKKFPKKTVIFKPGDKIDNVYFIRSGFVRTYTKGHTGENTLNIFKPLYIMSVMHCFVDYPNDLYFETLTPTEVSIIPKKDFLKLWSTDLNTVPTFIKYLCLSFLNYVANQGSIINGSSINKVATVLLQLSDNYGEDRDSKEIVVNFPTTHRIIANMVGLTRETTSVQMSKIQKLGVISTKRTQFVVKDVDKLKRLATLTK